MKRALFLFATLIFVAGSVWLSEHLTRQLKAEEETKVKIWAEATSKLINADIDEDLDLPLKIIESNNTIPVCLVSQEGEMIAYKNIQFDNEKEKQQKIQQLKQSSNPIVVKISDDITQYIYYEPSLTLKILQWFPYIQFFIIFIFIILAAYALWKGKQNENNLLWVGLSKETAHQLGTPISSLSAWHDLLETKYPNEEAFPEMEKDIQRLTEVAGRFSKIGSVPQLEETNIIDLLQDTMDYMQRRTSKNITYLLSAPSHPVPAQVNAQLFTWVIENLLRNAVDAINGEGCIDIRIQQTKRVIIDIADTGCGIERRKWKKVFEAGYTTKKRGWGLGLSLAKRIINQYHNGKIYITQSSSAGTTIRIEL